MATAACGKWIDSRHMEWAAAIEAASGNRSNRHEVRSGHQREGVKALVVTNKAMQVSWARVTISLVRERSVNHEDGITQPGCYHMARTAWMLPHGQEE